MASYYRNVGCGSNENVITGSTEAVQEGILSDTDKRPFTVQPSFIWEMKNRGVQWRAHSDQRVNDHLTRCQSACLFVTTLQASYGDIHKS